MKKNLLKTVFLALFAVLLFSCGSKEPNWKKNPDQYKIADTRVIEKDTLYIAQDKATLLWGVIMNDYFVINPEFTKIEFIGLKGSTRLRVKEKSTTNGTDGFYLYNIYGEKLTQKPYNSIEHIGCQNDRDNAYYGTSCFLCDNTYIINGDGKTTFKLLEGEKITRARGDIIFTKAGNQTRVINIELSIIIASGEHSYEFIDSMDHFILEDVTLKNYKFSNLYSKDSSEKLNKFDMYKIIKEGPEYIYTTKSGAKYSISLSTKQETSLKK